MENNIVDQDTLIEKSWMYIKTVVDVVRQPVLILDEDLHVRGANDSFYSLFQVDKNATEHNIVYELGNGQWNIPALKTLLEDILPKNTFFNGFEVAHTFPLIGRKVMMLNARQIHVDNDIEGMFPAIILLAMEDVSDIMTVADKLVHHTGQFEKKMTKRTHSIELHIAALQLEINKLKQ